MAPATIQELATLLADDTKVQVCAVDADGVLRGKIMAKDKFLSAAVDGFGFCSVVMGWDMHDQAYAKELNISNLANGYRDLIARIDLDTYRRTPTTPSLPFFLITFIEPTTNETLCACPRGLLQRINDQIEFEGYVAYAGAEVSLARHPPSVGRNSPLLLRCYIPYINFEPAQYEYFQFRETPVSVAAKDFKNLEPLTSGMHGYSMLRPELNSEYFHDIWDNCAKFGIPIEGHHTETGPGVFESALAYQPALRMADNATLFKWVAKTTGLKYGIMPTFMAKPYADQPGCSGHVHISLRDKSGKNIFAVEESEVKDGRADAKFEDTKRISNTAEHFLAGVLLGLPDIMPLLVPTVNGYKRLVESFWAPTRVMYAYENRIASVRIISPPLASPSATRLEIRVPGADMNPHLTFSAILALGLHGIKEKLELTIPPIDTSKGGAASIQSFARLPRSLASATENMKARDSMARKVLGDDFVDHFAGTRENETDLFNATVTDWELKRYFELA